MKRVLLTLACALLIGIGIGAGLHAQNFLQTPSVLPLVSTQVSANCPTPATGSTFYCWAFDKFEVSANGTAYVVIFPPSSAAAPSITINGTTKTLPGSFTLTTNAATVTAN